MFKIYKQCSLKYVIVHNLNNMQPILNACRHVRRKPRVGLGRVSHHISPNASLICRHTIPTSHRRRLLLHLMGLLLLLLHLLSLRLRLLSQLTQISEPRMLQSVLGTDAHLGSQLQHSAQEIQSLLVDLRKDQAQVLGSVDVEVGFVLGELRDAGPGALGWCAHEPEDLLQLVFVGCAGEEGAAGVHLCHDAPCGPDVDAGVVGAAAEEDVRGAIPESDNFVREGVDWDTEGAGKTEVGKF